MRLIYFQIFAALVMLAPATLSYAGNANYDYINYSRAEEFIPVNVIPTLYNVSITPNWIDGTNSFWYMEAGRWSHTFLLVDVQNRTRQPAFNHTALAAALAKASGEPMNPSDLPFATISFADGRLHFSALNRSWEYDSSKSEVHEVPPESVASPGETLSPDGTMAAFVQDHNLWIRNVSTGDKYPVTFNGSGDYAYAERSQTVSHPISQERLNGTPQPYAVWSPDSRRIATFRMDQRNVTPLYLLQYVPGNDSRPRPWTYRFAMPDNTHIPMYEPIVVDIQERKVIPVSYEAQPEVSLMDTDADVLQWWSDDGRKLYSLFAQRGEKSLRLLDINPENGSARELLNESGPTYVEANLDYASLPLAKVLKNGNMIWFSEKSGYGHLYLYGEDGKQKNPITTGDWVVRELIYVDENNSTAYFTAGGREKGCDPYYRHLYSVHLNGTGLELLTPEDADHSISVAPGGTAFIDTYSRVDLPPVTVLRDLKGNVTLTLETGDIENLTSRNWVPPERFSVKALDGKTDLYGLIFKPTDFNASRKYPVVETVYPGPWIIVTAKAFPGEPIWVDNIFWRAQALSELGFIVVTIDGPGTPYRSKAFHDASYGHLGDAGGLADHVNALKELAVDRPYMDLTRVGMFGHSAGGFMTAQALLTYPDFYKVGLASSGDYDSRFYGAFWGEKYEGPLANYTEQITALKADRLKGKLLLVAGDVDDNVNPCMTMQMVDAFIKADKPFDLLIMPNWNHDLSYDTYYLHRLFRYFVENLMESGQSNRTAPPLLVS
jgi:dipeptidyl-peptidase-4